MEQRVSALFAWMEGAEKTARAIAKRYQAAGMEISLYGQAREEDLILIGTATEVTHVLFFRDEERLVLVSLSDEMGGFTVELFVGDLILPN